MSSTLKPVGPDIDAPPLFDWREIVAFPRRWVGKFTKKKQAAEPDAPPVGNQPIEMDSQVVERRRRSQIFDKILGEIEETSGGGPPTPPKPPKRGFRKSRPEKPGPEKPEPPKEVVADSKPQLPQLPKPPALSATAEYSQKKAAAERASSAGDLRLAAHDFQQALELGARAGVDAAQLTRLQLEHADVLAKLSRNDDAKAALGRAEAMVHSVDGAAAHELRVLIDMQLGALALAMGEFSESERRHINAINRYEEHCTTDEVRLGRMYLDLGRVYFDADYIENAIEITLQAQHVFEGVKGDVRNELVAVYRQLAATSFKNGELESAVKHLLEAYRLATDASAANRRILTEIEITLATVYSHVGEYETAASWYTAAIEHQEQSNPRSKWPLSLLYANLALVQARGDLAPQSHCFNRSLDLQFTEMAMSPING